MVAHDTVEHFGNKEGWDRELIAFGATLYGRAQFDADMFKNVTTDFVNFMNEEQNWVVPQPKARWTVPMAEEDEKWLQLFIRSCKTYIKFAQEHKETCSCGKCKPMQPPPDVDAVLQAAVAWMRRGYKLARRLHHGRNAGDIATLEMKITKAVNKHDFGDTNPLAVILGLEPDPEVNHKEGDKLTVLVNRKDNTFQLVY